MQTLSVNANTKVPALEIKYDDFSQDGYTSATDWANSFTNTDEVNCPILKCEIKKVVDGKLVIDNDSRLAMSTSAPWKITYKSDEVEGYERDFTIECSNEAKSESVTHSMKQFFRCHDRLSLKTGNDLTMYSVMKYENTIHYGVVGDAQALQFDNKNEDGKCPITSCSLFQAGCKDPWTDPLIKLSGTQILSQVNELYGWNHKLCIRCTNGNNVYPRQTIEYDNYRVQQQSKCVSTLEPADNEFQPILINYDGLQNQAGKTIAQNYDSFFKNTDAINCPI